MEKENLSFYTLSSKQLLKKSGVYKLSAGGHVYVGSSKNLYARLIEHRRDLEKKEHSNDFLQKVANKYGINNIQVDIIEYCEPKDRIVREKYWIDELKSDMNFQDPVNHTLSEASKKKLSESIKKGLAEGKYKTKYDFSKIDCFDIFGNYITTYDNFADASKKTGITENEIHTAARNYKKGGITHNLRFRFSESDIPQQFFKFNEKYVGKYFTFNYIDKNGKETFAFNDVRSVWKFFGKIMNEENPKQITIVPRIKNFVNLGKPHKKGNPNPSA